MEWRRVKVDEGDIAGRFAHSYDAWTADVAETRIQRLIADATGIDQDDSVTLHVVAADGTAWSRVFRGWYGHASSACAFTTPEPDVVGVRVRGVVFIIDVSRPDEAAELDLVPVTCAASDVRGRRMFLASETNVVAFDGIRVVWESRRVALDNIWTLSYANGRVYGTGDAPGADSLAFIIDPDTGAAEGGFDW